jgi:hypoxanthine phosphoribosyltransferase
MAVAAVLYVHDKNKEKQDLFLKRVLIVDDDQDTTLTFKSALEREKR